VPITKQKNTNIFQLFHCQQTQSLLITLYLYLLFLIKTATKYFIYKEINKKRFFKESTYVETEKHQYFSIVSLPTDSVIVDHAVLIFIISN
jgi:ABC-type phosphate transport system permease subunit